MKQTFEDLILYLRLQSENYYYEAEDGSDAFDPSALWQEIRAFAEEFETHIN
jgi:hypothetical protein